jgi:hypothetical protein
MHKIRNFHEGHSAVGEWQILAGSRQTNGMVCVTAVLRSIPKEAFADSFQKLYERCRQCVVKNGDYFEGQYS